MKALVGVVTYSEYCVPQNSLTPLLSTQTNPMLPPRRVHELEAGGGVRGLEAREYAVGERLDEPPAARLAAAGRLVPGVDAGIICSAVYCITIHRFHNHGEDYQYKTLLRHYAEQALTFQTFLCCRPNFTSTYRGVSACLA